MTLYKANPENIHDGFTKPTIIPCNPKGHNMEAEIRDFVTAIQAGKQPPISPLEGASTVAVARATVESFTKGKPVKIKYPKY
jgi:predicted dehydrogenase